MPTMVKMEFHFVVVILVLFSHSAQMSTSLKNSASFPCRMYHLRTEPESKQQRYKYVVEALKKVNALFFLMEKSPKTLFCILNC